MRPSVVVGGARVFLGDCRDVLKTLPDNSVDSVVTDPPYELGFMGKTWDNSGIAYDVTVWEECLRVLKPGGHILAFGGTRTWHRLAVAIEDAGFEIRDNIAWLYGSGFPKSLDVSKVVDKKLGAEREVIATGYAYGMSKGQAAAGYRPADYESKQLSNEAITDEAQRWQGWGTALKPAFEPVVVGRKPLIGTVADNVLAWGVGGLNIDGSRIGSGDDRASGGGVGDFIDNNIYGGFNMNRSERPSGGRWPANVVLDEFTAGFLDEQSGATKSGKPGVRTSDGYNANAFGKGIGISAGQENGEYGDSGGASRFFYQAKASKRDRNEGLQDLEGTSAGGMVDRVEGSAGMDSPRAGAGRTSGAKNFHPTVKPTQLMRYLIKLVTPEGGVVLDPFTGSGSTGKAALLDGYEFIGAELTEEYLPIIEGRLRWALEQEGDDDDTLF